MSLLEMNKLNLSFNYPQSLIATKPSKNPRVLKCETNSLSEISKEKLLDLFEKDDLLFINNSFVLKRRIFSKEDKEILFLEKIDEKSWEVLFNCSKMKEKDSLELPGGVHLSLLKKGLPQVVCLNKKIDEEYFETYASLALPPYIQKKRNLRQSTKEDESDYQSFFAKVKGSKASPTASLHFNEKDFLFLEKKGVKICPLSLHIGLGTFLPLREENWRKKSLHEERVIIPQKSIDLLESKKNRVWALGTTVLRALESYRLGKLEKTKKDYRGKTDLFIYPPFKFETADILMTNFHQPNSSLLALVYAFMDDKTVLKAYEYAISKKFRLFSYGDLSVWFR